MRRDVLRVELGRATEAIRLLVDKEGPVRASRRMAGLVYDHARYPLLRRRRAHERFSFQGQCLRYELTRYNNTFRNERSIEIAVARWFLAGAPSGRLLEVGNVLAHYQLEGHDVIDRYETVSGVVNVDILDFVPTEPYDTVLSISTLEHVGQDEVPYAPERAIAAFDRLNSLVASDGWILVTIPIGYNRTLDAAIQDRRVRMPLEAMVIRVDRENRWAETSLEEGLRCRYGTPYANANAVYIGMRLASEPSE